MEYFATLTDYNYIQNISMYKEYNDPIPSGNIVITKEEYEMIRDEGLEVLEDFGRTKTWQFQFINGNVIRNTYISSNTYIPSKPSKPTPIKGWGNDLVNALSGLERLQNIEAKYDKLIDDVTDAEICPSSELAEICQHDQYYLDASQERHEGCKKCWDKYIDKQIHGTRIDVITVDNTEEPINKEEYEKVAKETLSIFKDIG